MAAPLARSPQSEPAPGEASDVASGTSRRHFLGYVLAAPTLMTAASVVAAPGRSGAAVIPSPPEPADLFDLSDVLTDAAMPTSRLITVEIRRDGSASFALPRAEVGQGITTAIGMLIAEELDLPLDKVHVSLADARPELLFNQITGGSNTIHAMYLPVRRAAAAARQRLVEAAATQWGLPASSLTTSDGVVRSPSGRTADYGSLTELAASASTAAVSGQLKDPSDFTLIGHPRNRVDALAAVTGQKVFAMDLKIPNALPTMVCRPPTLNAKANRVQNLSAVRAMPGITDVAIISTGVAVRGRTFGQCIDAIRALQVDWSTGTTDGLSDEKVLDQLHRAELPLAVPSVKGILGTIDESFTFYFRSNSPLETNCAVADVRPDSAEIWSSLKNPIVTQQNIAKMLKLNAKSVTCHVMQGGGSFGRHLFSDAAYEAAEASRAFGNKPVRLMWHRTDDFRHGRVHPMCTSRVRATYGLGAVLTYEQRNTSVATDFTHGLGEILTAEAAKLPGGGNLSFSESIFMTSQSVSYNYGVTTQLLNEIYAFDKFHTGSMRNVYSPDTRVAQELVTDKLAYALKLDPYEFRRKFLKDKRARAVLDKAAEVGRWGRRMPANMAQGIAVHKEYKGFTACLVEIDCRPATVGRTIKDAYTGPRVTSVVYVVDAGRPINPRGLEAQMQGGIMDGIAQALTSSLHLRDGHFLEGSWDNYWYTRQWNVPTDVRVIVMPAVNDEPGGAGEFGVAATQAAVACAYWRATDVMPTSFPINHNKPLGFEPLPTTPSIPASPINGLAHAF
jgi:isoquinoline 1-oxidoreductase subunit beta